MGRLAKHATAACTARSGDELGFPHGTTGRFAARFVEQHMRGRELALAAAIAVVGSGCAVDRTLGPWWERDSFRVAVEENAPPMVVQLAAGDGHTCALTNHGRVWCWGAGVHEPAVVEGITKVVQIKAVTTKTCALTSTGTISCWSIDEHDVPTAISGFEDAGSFSLGAHHLCALSEDRRVQCTGRPLTEGDGIRSVEAFDNAEEIVSGDNHVCARLDGGRVRCAGSNAFGQLGDGTRKTRGEPTDVKLPTATRIWAQRRLTCAAIWGGDPYCWGGAPGVQRSRPTSISLYAASVVGAGVSRWEGVCGWFNDGHVSCHVGDEGLQLIRVNGLDDVQQVVAGRSHYCALASGGKVSCWGDNDQGQLARPPPHSAVPQVVPRVVGATALGGGWDRTCATSANGTVHCWGTGPKSAPVVMPALKHATGFAASQTEVCALSTSGPVRCHDLKAGTVSTKQLPKPAVRLVGGGEHICAHLADGTVHCWASDHSPAAVANLNAATHIGTGYRFNFALLASGAVMRWYCMPGTGCSNANALPLAIPLLQGASSLATDPVHDTSCAISSKGRVLCWHRDGTEDTVRTGKTGAVEVVAGASHRCARLAGGDVHCWGANDMSQLGDGTLDDAVQLFSGSTHTCARTKAGTVRCWGDNRKGQLGSPVGVHRSDAPIPVTLRL